MNWPKNVLMVSPKGFEVSYAINPHMLDKEGNLNLVDSVLAFKQWANLKEKFEDIGLKVHAIDGDLELPDMVFSANQTFPFLSGGKTQFVLSQMKSKERQPEVKHFSSWAHENNFETYHLKTDSSFEGMGDALWNYETQEVFGGFGFRTSKEVYNELEQIIEKPIHRLELISEDFYHLDTCLAIANKETAFVVKEGFSADSFEFLKSKFSNLIEISYTEAMNGFAGNLCVADPENIIIQKGNTELISQIKNHGFKVHELDTSEFIKSGGSVFCMKQLFW